MTQVNQIQKHEENNLQLQDQNRFEACEKVVGDLIEKGIPSSFSPDNFISRISKSYGISSQEARTCLKFAIGQLEKSKPKAEKQEDKLNAQSGYFYPNSYSVQRTSKNDDGMDSLSQLSSYNRLMFNLR